MGVKKEQVEISEKHYWFDGVWRKPPVEINHGDLVDVKVDGYLGVMLGRYIGKGYGVVKLPNTSFHAKYIVGKVCSRGISKNPPLISDKELLKLIKD